tara:strand:+ start:1151 stop:1498 length:348 start_codon:yes stop_codon:yes gene_type:complete
MENLALTKDPKNILSQWIVLDVQEMASTTGCAWKMVIFNKSCPDASPEDQAILVENSGTGGPNKYLSGDRINLKALKQAADELLQEIESLDTITAFAEKGQTLADALEAILAGES